METVKQIVQEFSRALKVGKTDPDFFELVRLLEQRTASVGKSRCYSLEKVRFGQTPHLYFPKNTISEISEKRDLVRIFVYFMGVLGPNGAMPLDFSNSIFQRSHNYYDFAPQRFLDIAHHRFIGLFYRAWKHNEQAVQADNPKEDLITQAIFALSGGVDSSETKRCLPVAFEAGNADLLGFRIKSACGLELLLRRQFHLPVRVITNQLSRVDIPKEYCCMLGTGNCTCLGKNMQIGSYCWSRSSKFLIQTDVIAYTRQAMFTPGDERFNTLNSLICHYLERPLEYDWESRFQGKTLPAARLDGKMRIGFNMWLGGGCQGVVSVRIGASRLIEKKHGESYKKS